MEDRETVWYTKLWSLNTKKFELPKHAAWCKSQVLFKGKKVR